MVRPSRAVTAVRVLDEVDVDVGDVRVHREQVAREVAGRPRGLLDGRDAGRE
jgi:hypothetical protein